MAKGKELKPRIPLPIAVQLPAAQHYYNNRFISVPMLLDLTRDERSADLIIPCLDSLNFSDLRLRGVTLSTLFGSNPLISTSTLEHFMPYINLQDRTRANYNHFYESLPEPLPNNPAESLTISCDIFPAAFQQNNYLQNLGIALTVFLADMRPRKLTLTFPLPDRGAYFVNYDFWYIAREFQGLIRNLFLPPTVCYFDCVNILTPFVHHSDVLNFASKCSAFSGVSRLHLNADQLAIVFNNQAIFPNVTGLEIQMSEQDRYMNPSVINNDNNFPALKQFKVTTSALRKFPNLLPSLHNLHDLTLIRNSSRLGTDYFLKTCTASLDHLTIKDNATSLLAVMMYLKNENANTTHVPLRSIKQLTLLMNILGYLKKELFLLLLDYLSKLLRL